MIESELCESEKVFKELFENISSGVAIYETTDKGETFIIKEMNKAGLCMCEVARKEIVGKNLSELFPNVKSFGFIDALRRVWKTGKPEHSPTAFYQDERVDGWTEIYIYKLPSGKVVAIFDRQSELIEAEDITKRKRIETKFKESEEKFRKAYYQANLYRDIFAHDINNILQNIQSSAELSTLYLNNPEKLHTIKELYEIISEQVQRGRKLISNVRKINEIDESEVALEKVEIFHILNKAVEFLKGSFQARTIDIQINTSEKNFYVFANNLLLDVFENILLNAVRHNNKSKIEIHVVVSKDHLEKKNYIKMEFRDNGIGISDYRKKSIFEKGTRKNQKSKGMGLGLSLVKKIIDSYLGNIWVEDRVKGDNKQGSNFVILLQEVT